MEEMISRDAVLKILNHNWGKPKGYSQSVNEISELPTVQPKRGRWLKDGDAHYCSECGIGLIEFGQGGEPIYFVEGYNRANHERRITTPGWRSHYMQFCPHCGADMRCGDNGKT